MITFCSKVFLFFFVGLQLCGFHVQANEASQQKVLICGVGKDIAFALPNTIKNIEILGESFADYAVIIYENNSQDNTAAILKEWSQRNERVTFVSEYLSEKELPGSRTEKIARARNIVLALARDPAYSDFKYLVMADLDFLCPWPIEAITKTLDSNTEWDCVSANGCRFEWHHEFYNDSYAFRDAVFPFGPELIDENWYQWANISPFFMLTGHEWRSAFSAFGGLAIYKTASILPFSYSGCVTKNLRKYYSNIILSISPDNSQLDHYLKPHRLDPNCDLSTVPIIFRDNHSADHPANYGVITCCEHVPLHASMAIYGFGKFYINPEMYLRY